MRIRTLIADDEQMARKRVRRMPETRDDDFKHAVVVNVGDGDAVVVLTRVVIEQTAVVAEHRAAVQMRSAPIVLRLLHIYAGIIMP